MPNGAHFQLVAELSKASLLKTVQAAYDQQIIPHGITPPAGLAMGPLTVADSEIRVPRAGLGLDTAPADNGVTITLQANVQAQIGNPRVPSLTLLDMQAHVAATAPLGVPAGKQEVDVMLTLMSRGHVTVSLTSGDPIAPIRLAVVRELLHQKYTTHAIPATLTQSGVAVASFTGLLWMDFYDDDTKPDYQIRVSQPTPGKLEAVFPAHLRFTRAGHAPPLGVVAKIALTASWSPGPGSIVADFSTAAVSIEGFAPAPPSDHGIDYDGEGANYSAANGATGGAVEAALRSQLVARGQAMAAAIGPLSVPVPTVAQIESFIGDRVHAALTGKPDLPIWTPEPNPARPLANITPAAFPEALAIGLNHPAGITPAITPVPLPSGKSCAFKVTADELKPLLDKALDDSKLSARFLPKTIPKDPGDDDSHEVRISSLTYSLQSGFIQFEGDATVIDVTFLNLDVDAKFKTKVGLQWKDDPGSGKQIIDTVNQGNEIDIDDDFVEVLEWLTSVFGAILTGSLVVGAGLFGALNIVELIGECIGGDLVKDPVSGKLKGLGAWPDKLRAIGQVKSRFENPIDIAPDGITFYDGYDVLATFAGTTRALAQANGPYVAAGGGPVTLAGGPAAPDTTYTWDLGDGQTASAASVTHTYADNGIYVAKLTTRVTQAGGARTRHFAQVRVTNVPPRVDPGPPMTIDEGQEVDFAATFADPEWPDIHTAVFSFGDDAPPALGAIVETNTPPEAQGTASAKHAYCDNGEFTATVIVRDDDGGFTAATRRVTVLNVPPKVDAGEDLFAYVCTPITLVASFTDPGWCDTHTGSWDFGDCEPPRTATIREKHEPPQGTGIAAASHIYPRCGTYFAVCTVVDDDGGAGSDGVVVRVVDVRNRHFEDGFRHRRAGAVANEWEPYGAESDGGNPEARFSAEEFVVHGGQRAQRIDASGMLRVGIFQRVGANRGWDYQVSVWYHLDERAGGTCRLGVDPAGGADPASPDVAWSAGHEHRQWTQLTVRVTARQRAITIFLEGGGERQRAFAYFDDVELVVSPCSLEETPPPSPPRTESVRIDWKEERRPREVRTSEKSGFVVQPTAPTALQIVTWGPPPGQGKLLIPRHGLTVRLPFAADRVRAQVVANASEPVELDALDAGGSRIGQAVSASTPGVIQALEITASTITDLSLRSGGEGLLVEIRAYRVAAAARDR